MGFFVNNIINPNIKCFTNLKNLNKLSNKKI